MQDLLSHYERELSFLRTHAEEFGRRYPRVAGRLAVSGEVLQDPHVERMIQAFALLTSRVHKRLDDDFPLFAESFLDLLYPHYLRPFPSSSIVCFEVDDTASTLGRAEVVPRGTRLATPKIRGVTCTFKTTSNAQQLPARIASVVFRGTATAPAGTEVPRQATATLSIRLELMGSQTRWAAIGIDHIRLYLDGDSSLVTALREALTSQVLATMVEGEQVGPWTVDTGCRPRQVGLEEDDALLDFDARSNAAYRLLTEYFAFPEKFNFVDVPLPDAVLRATGRTVTLHFSLGGLRKQSDDARLLEVVSASNLLTGCAPVVNLFTARARPISFKNEATMHSVVPDFSHPFGHEIYAVDRVYRIRNTGEGDVIHTVTPFYSLQHGDVLVDGDGPGLHWYTQRSAAKNRSVGYETDIGLVDLDFDPAEPQTEDLSIDVRVTNRDLPTQMSIGNPGGDLTREGDDKRSWREIRLLRKPTSPYRFDIGKGVLWRLISHLSLNHLSLSAGGVDALKEMLRLYDLPRNVGNERAVDGILAVDYQASQAFLDGEPFATLVRGTVIRLTVDDQSFVGTGLHLFAHVLNRFFALYVHLNTFTQLKIVSSRTGEVLVTCDRRSGEKPLL